MSNPYYDSTGYPQTGASGSSASMRAELDAIEAGFNKLPTLAGNGGKIVKINAAANAMEASNVISDNGTDANITGDLVVAGGEIGQNAGQKHTIPQVVGDVFALLSAAQTLINKTIVAANNTIITAAVGNLTSTNLNAALAELQADIDTRATTTDLGTTNTNLANHLSDTVDAHDASAISNIPSGNLAATNVQDALNELQGDINAINPSTFALKSGDTFTGLVNLANGADIASASTVDLTVATGNTVRITGTTAITAFTMNAGQQMELVAVGALPLTYNATTMNINGGASYTCAAGDRLSVFKDGAGVVRVNVTKQDGTAVAAAAGVNKLQSFTAVAVGNDLVITINPDTWDFHSAALANGIPNRVTLVSAITLTIPNGATLGSVNNIASTYVVGVQNNAGTLEGFVINLAGGNQLDESNLITTTSISTGADSNNVAYATTGRSNLPYRIIGYFVNTQSTAGTYATQPTLVQGCGGQALASLSSLGYGQTRQNLSSSRAVATTYYNVTGKPFKLFIAVLTTAAGYPSMTIGGLNYRGSYSGGAGNPSIFSEIILPNESYLLNSALVSSFEWYEAR